ncbi:MAG: AAA family ATPase [Oscillospiraceae bacterium]|nr:AAA family ATPase [Oscillospiraceae bacterium]
MTGPYVERIFLREPLPESSYLNRLPMVGALERGTPLKFPGAVTFLVGENGTGKSTLLEAIAVACGFNAEGGTRNFNFSTRATHSILGEYLTVGKVRYPKDGFFLRAESFYNVATNIDELDEEPSLGGNLIDSYGGVSLHEQSHGESFLALIQNRFGGHGLYLLDEPEAALSPTRQLTLLGQMNLLVKEDSQFIIATHSPILMAFPGACIYQFSERGVEQTAYRETEHYQLTRRFLEDPERMLRYLFADSDGGTGNG